jgi:hypothetical protein
MDTPVKSNQATSTPLANQYIHTRCTCAAALPPTPLEPELVEPRVSRLSAPLLNAGAECRGCLPGYCPGCRARAPRTMLATSFVRFFSHTRMRILITD